MKVETFIETSFEELLSKKNNSFSRNAVMQNSSWFDRQHEYLFSLVKQKDTSEYLTLFLFICKNLTIHALNEEKSPISFNRLEEIYRNAVFILEKIERKNAIVVTLFRNSSNENNIGKFFDKSYSIGSGNKILNSSLSSSESNDKTKNFLDFGFIKCAMSMDKTYGIQNLLELSWQKFAEVRDKYASFETARFIFNVEKPNLSTITLYDNENLILAGKTKILDLDIDLLKSVLQELFLTRISKSH